MSARDAYQVLQSTLGRYSLRSSLEVIWSYAQFLQFNEPIRPNIEVPSDLAKKPRLGHGFFEWELELLARELILNSPANGRADLRSWNEFATAVNSIKDMESKITGDEDYRKLYQDNVLIELYRISHRQFPWQRRIGVNALARYFKMFSNPDLEEILVRKIGLNACELYGIGLAISGSFLKNPYIRLPMNSSAIALSTEKFKKFFDLFSDDFATLNSKIEQAQSYDQDFVYTLNPLKTSPLIRFGATSNGELMCPFVTNLLRRFSEGMYYELYNEPGFDNAFGGNYQKYVGEVIDRINSKPSFKVYAEESYNVGRDRKDTIDWIVEDNSAALFIECKTKKVRYASKFSLANTESLEGDFDKLSDFVIQAYKTLSDAIAGRYPSWRYTNQPVFIVIALLEEWYAFGDRVMSILRDKVEAKMGQNNLAVDLLSKYPYSVVSMDELERILHVCSKQGLNEVFSNRHQDEYLNWVFQMFLLNKYRDELEEFPRNLFPEALHELQEFIVAHEPKAS